MISKLEEIHLLHRLEMKISVFQELEIYEKLKSIQRISLINITKAFSTTSTEALQILAGVKPIHLKILEDTCIKRLKWNWRLNDFNSEMQQILLTTHMDDTPTRIHLSKLISVPYGRSLPTNSGLEIFTDGSRMEVADSATDTTEYRTGFSIVTKMYGTLIEATSTRISNNSSVYMAELVAINNAFFWLSKKEYPDATIYTDSLSSLQALQNPVSNSNIFENTKQLWRSNTLCNWVKAHIGTQGNEEADRAAKKATDFCQITLEVPSSIAQIKTQEINLKSVIFVSNSYFFHWKLNGISLDASTLVPPSTLAPRRDVIIYA
ncbi:uncharacterized protein [Parasteatoda tepidariorum]|uniref:uncharacterized protein n=1 Tax=Parasteatoda tepidariorum TaxID=114398 RepID=UPI0039BD19E1